MPEFMHFGRNLELGIDSMDEEHRDLVTLVNRLAVTLGIRSTWSLHEDSGDKTEVEIHRGVALGILKQLEYATRDHFLSEEALMNSVAYPKLEEHILEHKMLLAELRDYIRAICSGKESLDQEILLELKHWLLGHIIDADRHFAEYYRLAETAAMPHLNGHNKRYKLR